MGRTDTKLRSRLLRAAMAIGVALALTPTAPLAAQEAGDVTFDVGGGIGIPAGDLGDVAEAGPAFGLGVGWRIHPRIALRLGIDDEILFGIDASTGEEGPDFNLLRYDGGAVLSVLEPGGSPWTVDVDAGLGGTILTSEDQTVASGDVVRTIDLSEHYFTLNGGLRVGYDVSETLNVFVGGSAFLSFGDRDDFVPFTLLEPELTEAPETLWSFPVTAGARLTFPG